MRQVVIPAALTLSAALLAGCDGSSASQSFFEPGLTSSQFDTRLMPLKIGETYLAIPRNYIFRVEGDGSEGAFTEAGVVLLFAHWPTMEGRTPANRDQIYSAQSKNGYHVVSMFIQSLNGLRYPDDHDEFEFGYRLKVNGSENDPESPGPVVRDGSIYGYERYIRKNNWRIAFDNGPTALILRKLDANGRITSYVYCEASEFRKAPNYDPKGGRQNSTCELYIHHRNLQIDSSFVENNRLAEVAELEAAIRRKVDAFIAAGDALRRKGAQVQ